jgi:hypothetical protein
LFRPKSGKVARCDFARSPPWRALSPLLAISCSNCPQRRPPLTRRELRQIGQANKTPAVHDLLWELHRLRAIALKADQLENRLLELGIIARLDPTTKLIAESLAAALHDEPVVLEPGQARHCSGVRKGIR